MRVVLVGKLTFYLQDGNAGLVRRLVSRVKKHNVQTLTHVSSGVGWGGQGDGRIRKVLAWNLL